MVQIQSDSKQYYFERKYQKYPFLKDFLIGRVNWGRDPLTLKIESDSVSRDHTKLAYHCGNSN